MFKEINKTIREQELKYTFSLVESSFGTTRLKHVVTGQEIDLSFNNPLAAQLYAKRKGLQVK